MPKTKAVTTSGDIVLELLMQNQVYTSQPAEFKEAKKALVLAIFNILGEEVLSSRATFESLFKANLQFNRYCLDHGLAEKIAEETDKAQKAFADNSGAMKNKIVKQTGVFGDLFDALMPANIIGDLMSIAVGIQAQLSEGLNQYNEALIDPDKWLKDQGATKLQGLVWLGLSEKLAKKCSKNFVSIKDVLLTEPSVIVNQLGSNS